MQFLTNFINHCSIIEHRRITHTLLEDEIFLYFYQRRLEMQAPWNAAFLLEKDTPQKLNALNVMIPEMFQYTSSIIKVSLFEPPKLSLSNR